MELDVYVPKVGDLRIDEYLFLFSTGLLPEQDQGPSEAVLENTRDLFGHILTAFPNEAPYDPNVRVEPLTLSTIVEYVSHEGLLQPLVTPVRIDPYLLEPALTLGAHRHGEPLSYEDLSRRMNQELDAQAREALGR